MSPLRTDVPRRALLAVNLAAVAVIALLDWVTPPGVVVGIFLLLPVISSAYSDHPRDVWLVWSAALLGFFVSKLFDAGPPAPNRIWIPNRIFTTLTLFAGGLGALRLQALRLSALRTRDQAIRERELSNLLHTLLAHELRMPLAVADQTLEYVRSAEAGGAADRDLLASVHGRLRRSLDTVDQVLELARARLKGASGDVDVPADEVARALEADARVCAEEARLRGGRLELRKTVEHDGPVRLDLLVLRQSMAVVLGEAVRRAASAPLHVDVRVGRTGVTVEARGSGELGSRGLPAELEAFADLLRGAGGDLVAVPTQAGSWALRLTLATR